MKLWNIVRCAQHKCYSHVGIKKKESQLTWRRGKRVQSKSTVKDYSKRKGRKVLLNTFIASISYFKSNFLKNYLKKAFLKNVIPEERCNLMSVAKT